MFSKKESSKPQAVSLITLSDKRSTIAEQYRTIRSNIKFSMIDKNLKSLVVSSSGPGEGKSTTSANLAVVFADTGQKVLMVDADLRKPTVALTFKLPNQEGLSSLLSNRVYQLSELVQPSGIPNLDILTSGPTPPNPSEMLSSQRMLEVMREMENQYDLIIFDMPPLGTVTDAQIMAARTDGTILVVRERKTNKQSLLKSKELLQMAKANVIGVIYNGTRKGEDNVYYYYGG